jgi:4-carboxymuconolactone decarboxylase
MRGLALALGALMATNANAAERFPPLAAETMSPEQRAVAEAIQSGPRRSLGGPFNTWLRSPEFADRAQRVGEYIRFRSSLPARLNEFAILITARHWNAKYEWYAHYPLAVRAGLKPQIAADLAQGLRPAGLAVDEAAVFDFATELRRDKRVSDKTFAAARAALGEQGVVDLIAVSGYYDLVSMTLNVAEVAAPPDGVLPLPDLK